MCAYGEDVSRPTRLIIARVGYKLVIASKG